MLGVLAIAVFKAWYGLNLLSFGFTYAVGMLWTAANYRATDYGGVQAFVLLFFAMYVAIAVLVALRKQGVRFDGVSALLALATPFLTLIWQAEITAHLDKGLAYSALAGGLFYLVLAGVLFRRWTDRLASLREIFLFVAICLLALAVPLYLQDARLTSAVWAAMGLAVLWWGSRRSVRWMEVMGGLVQLAAGAAFVVYVIGPSLFDTAAPAPFDGAPFLTLFALGCAVVAVAGLVSAYVLHRSAARAGQSGGWLRLLSNLLLAWGWLWWFGGGIVQTLPTAADGAVVTTIVLFLSLSCAAFDALGSWLAWPALRRCVWGLLPALALFAVAQPAEISSPLEGGAWLVWPLALLVHLWLLWRNEGRRGVRLYHAAGLWLFDYLALVAVYWLAEGQGYAVTIIAAALLALQALVVAAALMLPPRLPRPIGSNARAYQTLGATPLLLGGVVYLIYANVFSPGATLVLPQYVPFVNPFDLASAALLAAGWLWLQRAPALYAGNHRSLLRSLRWGWGYIVFFCLNMALVRGVHQWADVPFIPGDLWASALLQTVLAIFWSVSALVLMFAARYKQSRALWFHGALLLGLTLVKLFVVDMAGVGAIARIVSFIGVGLLIIVIAFLAPVPPRHATTEPTTTDGTMTDV